MGKAKTFTLKTRFGLDGYGEAKVSIDKEYAKALLKRVNLFLSVAKKDKEAIELYFWDNSPTYFDGDEELVTDADQLSARKGGVAWCAYPHHGDVEMKTDEVSVDDLKKIANG